MNLRSFMLFTAVVVLSLIRCADVHSDELGVWIGTATSQHGESKGIYRASLDLESGALTRPELAAEIDSPGFVVVDSTGRRLYSVCRLPDGGGQGVASFQVLGGDRPALQLLNTQAVGDGGAAHLAVDPTRRCLFTAQYGSGSVAVFPLSDDGSIGPRSALVAHQGSGPNSPRQDAPHPHWVGVDPENQFLFVPDLGIDQVVVYRTDLAHAAIERFGSGQCPPGGGPRHMKFSPDGRFAYVVNELALAVTVFRHAQGGLDAIQTISTLSEELREVPNTASEIRMHPSGRFVYAANRGHDSIAVFRVDQQSGRLSHVELESIRGSWPRNFNIDPSGRWLIAAGRNSNTLALFRIDEQTGELVYTGRSVNCPSPICVEFQPPA